MPGARRPRWPGAAGVLRQCDTWMGRDEIAQYRVRPGCTKPQHKAIFVTEAAGWARKIEARRLCCRRARHAHTRPQSATCAERAVRLLSPRLLVVPRSAFNSFAPAALFLGI